MRLFYSVAVTYLSCLGVLEVRCSDPLLQGVVIAVEAGLDVNTLTANFTSRWDLTSAFFFCGTIITTIGKNLGVC